jgi:acetone carboxylase gamma subunit
MRVIKKGKSWEKRELVCSNTGCQALLEVTAEDLYIKKVDDYRGEYEKWIGFICPECGKFSQVKDLDSGSIVWERARKEKRFA